MFKERLNFALSLIKKNIAYYAVIAVAVIVSITTCAINSCTAGVIATVIIGLLTWTCMDAVVYHSYLHGEGDND